MIGNEYRVNELKNRLSKEVTINRHLQALLDKYEAELKELRMRKAEFDKWNPQT